MSKEPTKDTLEANEQDYHTIAHGIVNLKEAHKVFIEEDTKAHKKYFDFVTKESQKVMLAHQNIMDRRNNKGGE